MIGQLEAIYTNSENKTNFIGLLIVKNHTVSGEYKPELHEAVRAKWQIEVIRGILASTSIYHRLFDVHGFGDHRGTNWIVGNYSDKVIPLEFQVV